jgi:hypothetical protein
MAWSGDVWIRELLILLLASGANSVANVWVQVVLVRKALPGGGSAARQQIAVPIPEQAQGEADV